MPLDGPCLIVRTPSRRAQRGILQLGGLIWPCAVGRGGITARKREGDGASPAGCWRIEAVFWRADRRPLIRRGVRGFPGRPIGPQDGWCDAVGDANYNRFVRHPYPVSAERLWRVDRLYDVVVVLSHNRRPRVMGGGSAIFLHQANATPHGTLEPTAGCIALEPRHLLIVLEKLRPGARVRIA